MNRFIRILTALGTVILTASTAFVAEIVTVDNFVRAESDAVFARYVKQGALGEFSHERQLVSIDKQGVIRMNRDTLYSFGIFDLTEPVSIAKPDSGGRYQSMMVINENQYVVLIKNSKSEFTLTRDQVGTRCGCVIFRTFIDANDPADIKDANALQNKITARQKNIGKFEIPDWDEASLKRSRDTINVLAATAATPRACLARREKSTLSVTCLGRLTAGEDSPKAPPSTTTSCL